jgi:hypothetical protein
VQHRIEATQHTASHINKPQRTRYTQHIAHFYSNCVPYLSTRMTGHQRLNSLHQLESVDLGTMTRCGPSIFLNSCRYATMEMLCKVLPVGGEGQKQTPE